MKRISITFALSFALLLGCAGPLQNAAITTAVTVGATTGLRFVPASKRTAVANYSDYVATVLRTVTGTPTADQLTALINSSVPSSVKADFPELLQYLTPIIVGEYQRIYSQYASSGNAAAIVSALNAVAIGIEAADAPYITHS